MDPTWLYNLGEHVFTFFQCINHFMLHRWIGWFSKILSYKAYRCIELFQVLIIPRTPIYL
jgi:hypothetical protein